jgi:hypothetical protein
MWKVTSKDGVSIHHRTRSYPQRLLALQAAQGACGRNGASAEIIDSKGRLRFRYWRDTTGLQYLEY